MTYGEILPVGFGVGHDMIDVSSRRATRLTHAGMLCIRERRWVVQVINKNKVEDLPLTYFIFDSVT